MQYKIKSGNASQTFLIKLKHLSEAEHNFFSFIFMHFGKYQLLPHLDSSRKILSQSEIFCDFYYTDKLCKVRGVNKERREIKYSTLKS